MELLAEGRTAEVFAYGNGQVLKLDRPEWNGLSAFEATMLTALADAGLPVSRQRGTVTVDGRGGVILDRIDGPALLQVLAEASPAEVDALAGQFDRAAAALQRHDGRGVAGIGAAADPRSRGGRAGGRVAQGSADPARRAR